MNYEEAVWAVNEIKQLGIGFTPKSMRKFESRQVDSDVIGLKFLEPSDTTIEGQTIVPIVGVRIVMRTDRYPENPFDGTLVLDNRDLGAYEESEFLVENLTPGVDYFFGAYPYTIKDIFNIANTVENRTEAFVKGGEKVSVTAVVDEPDLFPYAYVTVVDLTTDTTEEHQIMANETLTFEIPIFHRYYLVPSKVDNFSTPSESDEFKAEGDGKREVSFTYWYSKNILDVHVTADNMDGGIESKEITITVHNVTDETTDALTKTGPSTFRFPVENEKQYYVTASEVEGYGTPNDSETITIFPGEVASVDMVYRYNVETINVTVTSSIETDDMAGTEIGLWLSVDDVMTLTERKTYENTPLVFHVDEGIKYYVAGITQMDGYGIPTTETFTAVATNIRYVELQYVYNMETAKVTVSCEGGGNIVGETIVLNNTTTSQKEEKVWSGDELKFFVPNGESYYVQGSAKTGYIRPKSATFKANVGNVRDIQIMYKTIKPLSSLTWDEVREVLRAGQGASSFHVGDTKGVWKVYSVSASSMSLVRTGAVSTGSSYINKRYFDYTVNQLPNMSCINEGLNNYKNGAGKTELPGASFSFSTMSGGPFTSNSARAYGVVIVWGAANWSNGNNNIPMPVGGCLSNGVIVGMPVGSSTDSNYYNRYFTGTIYFVPIATIS